MANIDTYEISLGDDKKDITASIGLTAADFLDIICPIFGVDNEDFDLYNSNEKLDRDERMEKPKRYRNLRLVRRKRVVPVETINQILNVRFTSKEGKESNTIYKINRENFTIEEFQRQLLQTILQNPDDYYIWINGKQYKGSEDMLYNAI